MSWMEGRQSKEGKERSWGMAKRERKKEGGRKEQRTNKQVKKNQCKEYLGCSYELFLG